MAGAAILGAHGFVALFALSGAGRLLVAVTLLRFVRELRPGRRRSGLPPLRTIGWRGMGLGHRPVDEPGH